MLVAIYFQASVSAGFLADTSDKLKKWEDNSRGRWKDVIHVVLAVYTCTDTASWGGSLYDLSVLQPTPALVTVATSGRSHSRLFPVSGLSVSAGRSKHAVERSRRHIWSILLPALRPPRPLHDCYTTATRLIKHFVRSSSAAGLVVYACAWCVSHAIAYVRWCTTTLHTLYRMYIITYTVSCVYIHYIMCLQPHYLYHIVYILVYEAPYVQMEEKIMHISWFFPTA